MMAKKLRLILWLICILWNAGGMVRAQEELPIVDGYVRGHSTEVLFPMAVRFRVTFSQIADLLSSVTLRIEPAGQAPIDVTLDLKDDVLIADELHTEFQYVWDLPADISLPLFSRGNVVFEWQAVDTVGRTARVRDALDFRDDRIFWTESEDPEGRINLYVPGDGPDPNQIRQGAQLAYDLITTNLGQSEPVNVIIYGPQTDLTACELRTDAETGVEQLVSISRVDGLAVTCDPNRAAAIFANNDFAVIQAAGNNLSAFQMVLVEWLVRHLYETVWAENVPDWFKAGLVDFYQPVSKARLLQPVQTAARTNRLLTLAQMSEDQGNDLWTAQRYAMVVYIADLIGV